MKTGIKLNLKGVIDNFCHKAVNFRNEKAKLKIVEAYANDKELNFKCQDINDSDVIAWADFSIPKKLSQFKEFCRVLNIKNYDSDAFTVDTVDFVGKKFQSYVNTSKIHTDENEVSIRACEEEKRTLQFAKEFSRETKEMVKSQALKLKEICPKLSNRELRDLFAMSDNDVKDKIFELSTGTKDEIKAKQAEALELLPTLKQYLDCYDLFL